MIGHDTIEHASLTDVGIRRGHNQDAHATLLASDDEQWQVRGHIFLVADGMGAHAVGELASELAVSIIPHTYHKYAPQNGVPALRKAFVEANASIHAKGQQNPEFGGMGTTTTALLLRPEGAWVGHVGDSRAYRIRHGVIEQMSFDHSLVWEMARRQHVDPDGLEGIPSNVIVRSLGPEPLVQVDLEGPHPIEPGDVYLLCSDGLSGQVTDQEIGAVASLLPPAEACHFLIDLANLRGGPDNITALIVRVNEQAVKKAKSATAHALLPWPVIALIVGLVFVTIAGYLTAYQYRMAGIAFFLVAAIAIILGVIGLSVSFGKEKRRQAQEPVTTRPRMYRQASCTVEQPLLDKLIKATTALEQHVKERQWNADWMEYQTHAALGNRYQTEQKLADSFSEYCRAMHVLAEAMQQQRPKGEEFRPLWDK
ncbi:MAG TPA: protein phosphatase 2C domain-containing protein [Gemmataceae bacterium]|nr:protein phosphatase 2C domain-containing protein [Gemmataceae bacterium]